MKVLRTTHSWLGIMVFPWIIIIGLTGVYLNHSQAIYSFIKQAKFSESQFKEKPRAEWGTREKARSISNLAWNNQPVTKVWEGPYHGRPSIYVKNPKGLTVLSIRTGHYYLKTRYTRRTFSPDGELLHTKYYWGAVFKVLHRAGWLGGALGTWIADVVGLVMMIFGISGMLMWSIPRVKRLRARLHNR